MKGKKKQNRNHMKHMCREKDQKNQSIRGKQSILLISLYLNSGGVKPSSCLLNQLLPKQKPERQMQRNQTILWIPFVPESTFQTHPILRILSAAPIYPKPLKLVITQMYFIFFQSYIIFNYQFLFSSHKTTNWCIFKKYRLIYLT